MKHSITLILLIIFASLPLHSQDLGNIGDEKPLKVSGGLSVSQIAYAVNGIESRRDPYSWFATGNLNFSLYGWSVPLSFSVSNQNTSFQQPFNQYGLSPTYKWVRGYIGYNSMSFSRYTLGGHIFNGVGVDLEPGEKFRFSAMYGKLLKAVEPDSTQDFSEPPAFKRMGYGFKASYITDGTEVNLSLFKAKDEINSISYVPEEEDVLPEENLSMALEAKKMLFSKIKISAEIAGSALTRDTRSEKTSSGQLMTKMGNLYRARVSSSYYNAFNTNISYNGNGYALGLGYERIDPGYRTLGAYYFNNDLENITANGALALLSGKVNLSGNVGIQKDNLDKQKISSMKRWVGSINVGFVPSEKLNTNLSYSSFSTYTNIRSQFLDINRISPLDHLDTLNFTQLSQNASLNMNYSFSANENKKQNVSMMFTLQDATDQQGGVEQNSGITFYNINAAYSINYTNTLSITTAFNYSGNRSGLGMSGKTLGPTLAVNRSFFDKKLRTSFSTSWNNTFTNNEFKNRVINFRVSSGYRLKEKHNINLNLVTLNRHSKEESTSGVGNFTEYTATLGYNYNF